MNSDNLFMTDRIKYLHETREDSFDRSIIPHRDEVYEDAFAKMDPDTPVAIKFAKAMDQFLSVKKIQILERDVLAGYHYKYSWNTTLPTEYPLDYDPSLRPDFELVPHVEAEKCQEFYGLSDDSPEMEKFHIFGPAVETWFYKHYLTGHVVPGYLHVLDKGLKALQEHGEECLKKAETKEQKDAIESMLIASRAESKYILRYSAMAKQMAEETKDEENKKQLQKIAAACDNIAYNKPDSFFEAVQLLWITHEVTITETPPVSVSLGRVDTYLYPFYKADLDQGLITYDEAQEIIDALWIKFSSSEHAYQNVTLGGYDADGGYTCNPVTYMCMRATRKLRYDQPLISLRYTKNMPDEFWDEVVELLLVGMGFPALFNDDAIIPVKKKFGLSDEDAKNYGVVGCVEMTGSGCEYSNTEALRLNIPGIIEAMLNNGIQRLTGTKVPLETEKNLDEIKSFEEFYDWFKAEFKHYATLAMDCVALIEDMWSTYWPEPFLSSTMQDCYDKGKDVTGGGARYNNSALNGCGFANAVDSLAAIKKLVFEDKVVSLSELAQALACNFEGYEDLHHMAVSKCPKYGNDVDEVDQFLVDIIDLMYELTEGKENGRGGKYQIGLYSVEDHAFMGECTGALPDGRLSGVALANAMGPVQGMKTSGPTAVVNSVLKANLKDAGNGMVLDLKFNPNFLSQKAHSDALRMLINTFFKEGGIEIQFNVIAKETLLAAQKDPKAYKELVVRVSGFSAYFCNLLETTQNEIIMREEYDYM